MKAKNLKVNRLASTVGISSGKVTFSWLSSGVQTGFILSIKSNGKLIFESGIITSTDYSYTPDILIPSRSFIEWSVTLIDETEKIGKTDGGILTVGSDMVTLLSGSFTF
jgi:hypothetical protein